MVLHTFQNRSLRVPFQRPVLVKVVGDGSRTLGATALNLSSQGMFLSTPEAIAPGTQLHLALLAGGKLLPFAHAVVVRESMAPAKHLVGVGVQFTTFLHPKAAEMIGHVVSLIDTTDAAPTQRLPRRRSNHRAWALAATVLFVAGAAFAAVRLQAPVMASESTPALPKISPTASSAETSAMPDSTVVETPLSEERSAQHSRTFHLSTGTIKALTLTENEGMLSVDVDTTRRTHMRATLLENPRRLKLDIDTRGPKAPKTIATGLASATAVHISRLKNKTQLMLSLSRPVLSLDEPKIATEFLVRARREDEGVPAGTSRMSNKAVAEKDQRVRIIQAQDRSEQVTQVNTDGGRIELSLRDAPESPLRLGRAGIAVR